ncbi:hypothetical protein BU16DRAFT_598145 [Lophium mytilinum]|uniref:F-box domain-containing protein n=1 Tax=Lophium mytilinum TaxID=390894 RepID=A0A6A6QAJ0_9PEZI|nr:hypothetical protein BU16DRAFT_598145 [Lophium mytilinum]
MSPITDLPCELVASILRNLDNFSSLLPSLLACRHFYSSFTENPRIQSEVLQRQVTPALLPYSIALMEASRLPRPRTAASIHTLLDTLYKDPAQLIARLQTMPLPMVLRMGCTHNVIHDLAAEFATDAWGLLLQGDSRVSGDLSLSSKEEFRFHRAFYRVELFFQLFRDYQGGEAGLLEAREFQQFLSRHPPWENEQLGCVHDFLEKRLSEASLDVVAHDIEFGEYEIDYLEFGGENYWKQLWMSQGVHFIYQLLNEDSYEAKKALLKSAFSSKPIYLHDALSSPAGDTDYDHVILEDYDHVQIEALAPRRDDQDTDKGPFSAWFSDYRSLPRDAWVMFSDKAGLRERAYVLWDSDRIKRFNLMNVFSSVPEDPSYLCTDEDIVDDMRTSFDERSKIWQKGGSGYWSKNDTSKVEWPSKPILKTVSPVIEE